MISPFLCTLVCRGTLVGVCKLICLSCLLQFLAFRLGEVKADCQTLQSGLTSSRVSTSCMSQPAYICSAISRQNLCTVQHGVMLPSQVESAQLQQQLQECQQQLSGLQEQHSRQTLELEAQLREQAAVAQQDKLEQVAAVRAQLER